MQTIGGYHTVSYRLVYPKETCRKVDNHYLGSIKAPVKCRVFYKRYNISSHVDIIMHSEIEAIIDTQVQHKFPQSFATMITKCKNQTIHKLIIHNEFNSTTISIIKIQVVMRKNGAKPLKLPGR